MTNTTIDKRRALDRDLVAQQVEAAERRELEATKRSDEMIALEPGEKFWVSYGGSRSIQVVALSARQQAPLAAAIKELQNMSAEQRGMEMYARAPELVKLAQLDDECLDRMDAAHIFEVAGAVMVRNGSLTEEALKK